MDEEKREQEPIEQAQPEQENPAPELAPKKKKPAGVIALVILVLVAAAAAVVTKVVIPNNRYAIAEKMLSEGD